jgi:hypothetical protein
MWVIIIALAVLLQCANVYVMCFAEHMHTIGPLIESRMRQRIAVDVEAQEQHVPTWRNTITRCLLMPPPAFVLTVSEYLDRPCTVICNTLSSMMCGLMLLSSVPLFYLGMQHYSAKIPVLSAVFFM